MSIIKKNTKFILSMSLILGSSLGCDWSSDANMKKSIQNQPMLVDSPSFQPQRQNHSLKQTTPINQHKPLAQQNQIQGSGLKPKMPVVAKQTSPQSGINFFDDLFSEVQKNADVHNLEQEKIKQEKIEAEKRRAALKKQQPPSSGEVPRASGGKHRGDLGQRGRVEQDGIPNLQSVEKALAEKKRLAETKEKRLAEQKRLAEEKRLLESFRREFSGKLKTAVKGNFDLYKSLMSDSLQKKMADNSDFITNAISQKNLLNDLYGILVDKKYDRHFKENIMKDLKDLGFAPIGSEGNDQWIYKNEDQVVVRLKLEEKFPGQRPAYNLCMYEKGAIERAAENNIKPVTALDNVLKTANKGRNLDADLDNQLCLIYLFPKDDGTITYRLLPSHPGSFYDQLSYRTKDQNELAKNQKIIRFITNLLGPEADKYDLRKFTNIETYAKEAINYIMRLGHGEFNINSR